MFAHERSPAHMGQRISLATIDKVVAARLGQTRVEGNAQPAVFNRQIAMYLAKHVGRWSTTRIGRFYNGRDHSTVCHAVKRVAALCQDDPEVDSLVTSLANEIKTAAPKESGRTDSVTRATASANEVRFNDAFFDALADRLATRIFDRVKEIVRAEATAADAQ
jgi:hypothetical protein